MHLICLSAAALVAAMTLGSPSAIQDRPPQPPLVRAQDESPMRKLDVLVGEWKGGGWIRRGQAQMSFDSTEIVRSRAAGSVLVVEGLHTSKMGDQEIVVHDAVAVIDHDAEAGKYRFHGWTARDSGMYDLTVQEDGSIRWTIDSPPVTVRFTIRIENGQWHEIGEFRQQDAGEDAPFTQFFEMTLEKVEEEAEPE